MYIIMYINVMSRDIPLRTLEPAFPPSSTRLKRRAVELTRRGKPVAVVISLREFERLRGDRPRFSEAYKKFLDDHSLAEIGLDDDFAATTRDRSPGRKISL